MILATAFLWMTEAMPLMITALIPAIMFPLVGIMDTKEVMVGTGVFGQLMVLGAKMPLERVFHFFIMIFIILIHRMVILIAYEI